MDELVAFSHSAGVGLSGEMNKVAAFEATLFLGFWNDVGYVGYGAYIDWSAVGESYCFSEVAGKVEVRVNLM